MAGKQTLVKSILSLFILLPVLLLSSGCSLFGDKEKIDVNDHTLSVVFGYFDVEEAPSWGGVDWVSIKKFKPKKAYYGTTVEEGLFYHLGVSNNSSIQVDEFGRNTRWYSNAVYTYNFGGQGRNDTSTVINKPGVYFLGAYKYKHIDSGSLFKADSFDMEKSNTPTEKELFTRLLASLEKESPEYTYQIAMVKKRLSTFK